MRTREQIDEWVCWSLVLGLYLGLGLLLVIDRVFGTALMGRRAVPR